MDPLTGRADAALTALFTPAAAPPGTFEVFRSSEPIAQLAARLRARDPAPRADAWRVLRIDALDAFGAEGRYDHGRLARLYNGQRTFVARGSLHGSDGVVGFTLITPSPDPTLAELRDETVVIVAHASRLLMTVTR